MKKFLKAFLGIAILMFSSCATSKFAKNPLTYQEIIEVPNENKTALYIKINSVAVDMFNNADSVIQFSDKEAGIIKGKYTTQVVEGVFDTYKIYLTITAEAKDSKVRLSFTDVTASEINSSGWGIYSRTSTGPEFEVETDSKLGQVVLSYVKNFATNFRNRLLSGQSDW